MKPSQHSDVELLMQITGLTATESISVLYAAGGLSGLNFQRAALASEGALKALLERAEERLAIYRELHTRSLCAQLHERAVFTELAELKSYLSLEIGGLDKEVFFVLYLDSQQRLIDANIEFTGSICQSAVYPREVVKSALKKGASHVVLSHNHPSGDLTPSEADKRITRTLREALALIDVRVVDHIIVGQSQTLSMLETGNF
jgi:DNA repair protein RadC